VIPKRFANMRFRYRFDGIGAAMREVFR
jgi:hypothetical protein